VNHGELTPEQVAIQAEVRELMERRVAPRAAEIDAQAEFPDDVLRLLIDNEVFRLAVPPEYGGRDGRLLTFCLANEQVTRVSASVGMILGNQYLGAGPIALFGSDEQKERYLPRFASGELLASFALTEPEAGSDVAGMRSRAVRDGDGWRLSGRKVFITHADVADTLTAFAKADGNDRGSITAFLLDRDTSPWVVDGHERKLGLRGSTTCSVVLDDVWAPDSSRLGEVGDGMRIALSDLNKGRISTAAMALGIAQGALDELLAADLPQRQYADFALAEMQTEIEAARGLVHKAARRFDGGGEDMIRLSATAKLYATDMVNRVTARAVELLGEAGSSRRYGVERMMRDARVFAIFEGTNEIQKIVIARELRRRAPERAWS
jgi:alkylation response protein AidB-like acyl-CoA dehydrogenase